MNIFICNPPNSRQDNLLTNVRFPEAFKRRELREHQRSQDKSTRDHELRIVMATHPLVSCWDICWLKIVNKMKTAIVLGCHSDMNTSFHLVLDTSRGGSREKRLGTTALKAPPSLKTDVCLHSEFKNLRSKDLKIKRQYDACCLCTTTSAFKKALL